MRLQNGLTFQGGTSTGQNVADARNVRANLPEVGANIGAGLLGSAVEPFASTYGPTWPQRSVSRCLSLSCSATPVLSDRKVGEPVPVFNLTRYNPLPARPQPHAASQEYARYRA